jgi:ABC-type molybdenum transport system ATPase subunit/photorepair protein PhrA
MAVIVGRNGSGKSTLLSRLARVLHASQKDRTTDVLMDLGTVAPAGISFTRIVNIAYSAFDTFQLSGV